MEEAEALRQAYIAEQEEGRQHETVLDSGIDIPSSQFIVRSSSPGIDQASSTPVIHSSPRIDQASIPLVIHSSPRIDTPSSPRIDPPSSPPVVHSRLLEASIAEEVEFQIQQNQYKQAQAYAQSQEQKESRAAWELERQLEEWKGRCPLCFINGHDSRHSIDDCVQRGSGDIQKGWQEMKTLMAQKRWFAMFSCCFDCHVPQAICQKWVQKKEQGKWERLSNASCQFDNIIMPMVITAMLEGKDWMIKMIQDWVEGCGVELGNQEQMYKWFGQKVDWGGIEASRLVQVFYRLAKGIETEPVLDDR